jgi:protein-arginine kinase activator protein McsA
MGHAKVRTANTTHINHMTSECIVCHMHHQNRRKNQKVSSAFCFNEIAYKLVPLSQKQTNKKFLLSPSLPLPPLLLE